MAQDKTVAQDSTLNLAKLIGGGVDVYETRDEGMLNPPDDLLEAGGLTLAEPIQWEITVRSTGGDDDFILEGNTEGVSVMECRRCLDEVLVGVSSDFIYPMVYRPGGADLVLLEHGEDEEDTLQFGKPEVDFAGLITQLFAIDQPLTALCREDCRGLSSDGVNLNEHPDHVAPVDKLTAPSPFAVLKDLEV